MITKKLMHDIQTWLNSLYNFDNPNDDKNKHIISVLENFAFRFISISIRIWSLRADGTLYVAIRSYNIDVKNEEEFKNFKTEVNSTIDNCIKIAINETNKNKENGNRT